MKILLVEDDVDLGNVLAEFLKIHDIEVDLVRDGQEGWEAFRTKPADLSVLDVMLPGMDGFTLAEKIKKKDLKHPIIFLTAKTMKEDRIKGLALGADDYICKPFEADELVLRIKNIIKRVQPEHDEVVELGGWTFHYSKLDLTSSRRSFHLTIKEADLLMMLYNHRDKVVLREEILEGIWGENDYFLGRSLDVFISRLRKYFSGEPGVEIRTIRGKGFMLMVSDR
jgi:DNA-binding response OmpR family regulator